MIRRWVESRLTILRGWTARNVGKSGTSVARNRWIEALYIVAMVAMGAGAVSAISQPVDFRYIIFPSRSAQSISETIINVLSLAMGGAGVYLSYLSGRQTTKPRMVSFYLSIGLLLIATAVYVGIYVYISKG